MSKREIIESETKRPPRLDEKGVAELAKGVQGAADAFEQFQTSIRTLPKDISASIMGALLERERLPVKLAEGSRVEVMDFTKAHQTINEIRQRIIEESKHAVKKSDLKSMTEMTRALQRMSLAAETLSGKEFKVVLNAPDSITIENWPKKPGEAIPVRLVTADGKKFYEAIMQGVADVVGGILGARSSGSGGGSVAGAVTTESSSTGTLNNGAQTTVAGVAVQVAAANSDRKKIIVQNVGAASIRLGVAGVTATTGMRLAPSQSVVFEMPWCPVQALFAIREGAVSSIALAQEIV